MIHSGGFLVASVVVLLYNVGVEKYGNHRMEQMAQIPPLECTEKDDDCVIISTADLRRTVSSRSGLVENLDDRRAWNKWLLSTAGSKNSKKDGYVAPGKYYFKYRSYVNFEESGAIKKALLHIPTWLGFVAERTGEMKVYPDGRRVTITDFFPERIGHSNHNYMGGNVDKTTWQTNDCMDRHINDYWARKGEEHNTKSAHV